MGDRKTILAVDDMSENLTAMRSILHDFFDVRLAKSAKMALTLLQNTKVDMILLDIEMPGMSGFEFLEQQKSQVNARLPANNDIPVIFVTSHASTEFINRAINSGAKDYLVKPIRKDVLLKKVEGVIGLPGKKTAPNPLEDKLKMLIATTNSGDSVRSETLIKELLNASGGTGVHVRRRLDEIAQLIRGFEYDKANSKIKELLVYMSLS
jgi:putative two-component system response regulator